MPNKTVGIMPTNLTSFSTTSHSRTYFVPYPAFGPNGSTTGPFSRPYLDTFGDAQRNSYTGPSFFNTDLAALKNTPIRENISAQFRMDAFNVFNTSIREIQEAVALIAQAPGSLPGWQLELHRGNWNSL